MKFKNGLNKHKEKMARQKYWDSLSPEDRQIVSKAMVQVYGGDTEHARKCLENDFINRGVGSERFIKTIIDWDKTGKPYLLSGL